MEIREEVVYDVFVGDIVHINPAVYALWLAGFNGTSCISEDMPPRDLW